MDSFEKLSKRASEGSELPEPVIEEISDSVKLVLERCSPMNLGIKNYNSELQRFRESGPEYSPDFRFEKLDEPRKTLEVIEYLEGQVEGLGQEDLEIYGNKRISAKDMRSLFRGILKEFRLYTELGKAPENPETWRESSEKIWNPASAELARRSLKRIERLDPEEHTESLDAGDLRDMFEEELGRLGMEYEVEVRSVKGCFNIPQEQKLVVSEGTDGERRFSRQGARKLTMHEVFHAARAYNGIRAGRNSGFPDFLGIHTPFYDQTEEGGAVYREERTGVLSDRDRMDYHLRRVAAYRISESESFRDDFHDIIEQLEDLGATKGRAFRLLARNRQMIRHQIYQSGFENWQDLGDPEKLLVGKMNTRWAKKFMKEAEAGGMIAKPAVSAGKLFNYSLGEEG